MNRDEKRALAVPQSRDAFRSLHEVDMFTTQTAAWAVRFSPRCSPFGPPHSLSMTQAGINIGRETDRQRPHRPDGAGKIFPCH